MSGEKHTPGCGVPAALPAGGLFCFRAATNGASFSTPSTTNRMRINVRRADAPFHFVATNPAGIEIHMDSGPQPKGAGPVQMLVMAMAGCSGIDIVDILAKGRQQIDTFDMELDYERAKDQVPALVTTIHAHYVFTGALDEEKVRRAIELSIDKYCTVSKMLEKTAAITFSFSINGTRYEGRR